MAGRNYLNSRGYTFWERYLPSLVEQVDEINGTYYSKAVNRHLQMLAVTVGREGRSLMEKGNTKK